MASIEQSIEVDVPVNVAYNQWTQFESFPKFMEGVKSVQQLDDRRLMWHAEVAGRDKDWEAEITEQHPDERIAWRSISGAPNAGVVTFHRLSDTRSKIMLQLDYEPEGVTETIGDAIGATSARVRGDLERFKQFIESRGSETGAWRGEIESPSTRRPAA